MIDQMQGQRVAQNVSYAIGLKTAATMLEIGRSTLIRRIRTHGEPSHIALGAGRPNMYPIDELRQWYARTAATAETTA